MKFIRMTLFILFFAVAGITVVSPMIPSRAYTEEPLVIGVFPRRHQAITVEIFTPMAKHLQKNLQRRVRLESGRDFKTFWKGVKEKRFDIVHFNQYHYLLTTKNKDYEVFAMNKERGKATISGSIVVRKDSGINNVQDLKGKKILFGGGPKAMQSYIIATYLLNQGGLKKGDYEVMFAKNPPSAIVSTYFGLWGVSAAGAGDVVLKLPIVAKQVDTDQLKFLTRGEPHAHLPWAVKSSLDPELKQRIRDILLSLSQTEKGKKILKKAKLNDLVAAKDSDFDPHRKIVKAVLNQSF